MEWLTPMTAIYAGLLAVPALLALSFLKLKRREHVVSCTLLWKRAVQDLQVNAPFQRLRRNILLLLQMLAIIAMLLALAGPIFSRISGGGGRYVLLIDRSASMGATDVKPTRLDEAKKQAKAFVESVQEKSLFRFGGDPNQIMVIAFDERSKLMCNFTSDKRQILAAIDAIEPGDGDSALSEAVVVAQAFATPEQLANNRSSSDLAKLILFSDGRIDDLDKVIVGSDELDFHCIGASAANVAVTAMRARRSYEHPDEVEIFASLTNYAADQVTCDVQLSISGNVHAVKSVSIPARQQGDGEPNRPGRVAVDFSLTHPDAGVVEVRHLNSDPLAADDAAWAILSPPKRISVLLVTRGNSVLESALRSCSLAGLKVVSPTGFDPNDISSADEQSYDLIVLDDYVPPKLPRSRYMVFGRPPQDIGVTVAGKLENQVVVDWRPKHAVMVHVNLMNLFAAESYKLDLPRDAEVLAEFGESPAIALVRRSGSIFLLAAFDVLQSNWPFEPGFVLFCYNAANFLAMQTTQGEQTNLDVGRPIIAEGLQPQTPVTIEGPGISGREMTCSDAGAVRFPGTDRVGVYSLSVPDQETRFFAVNLLDSQESDIGPRREIELSGQVVQAQQDTLSRASLPLWPLLVVVVLLLACLEWVVYSLKMKL